MGNYSLLEKILIISIMALFVLVAVLPNFGCAPANRTNNQSAGTQSAAAAMKAVTSTNWTLSLATLGIAGAIFAMMMGHGKIGLAALVACIGASAYTIATIRYSWVIALGGLAVGVLAAMAAFNKNRATIFSFIDGFQAAKDRLILPRDEDRKVANRVMGGHLTPDAERLVKCRKKQLEKEKEKCDQS